LGITKNKINPVIFGLNGYYLNQNEIKMIKDNSIYGFIFFKRNIKNLYQFKSLINHIRYLSSNNPILMIDHEGGRINRFNSIFSQTKYTGEYFGELYTKGTKNYFT
jgi:beta-N-acetylhexosaminidase